MNKNVFKVCFILGGIWLLLTMYAIIFSQPPELYFMIMLGFFVLGTVAYFTKNHLFLNVVFALVSYVLILFGIVSVLPIYSIGGIILAFIGVSLRCCKKPTS